MMRKQEKLDIAKAAGEALEGGSMLVRCCNGKGVSSVEASYGEGLLHIKCLCCGNWHNAVEHVSDSGHILEWCVKCRGRVPEAILELRARDAALEERKRERERVRASESRVEIRKLRKVYVRDRFLFKQYAKRVDELLAKGDRPTEKLEKALAYRKERLQEEKKIESLIVNKRLGFEEATAAYMRLAGY